MSILPQAGGPPAARPTPPDCFVAEHPNMNGTLGHTARNLLLLYNNDLFTVQTRDEQEETKTKVKQTRSKCEHRHTDQTDQTVKGTTKYSVSVQSSVTQKR